jgi:hypothetical protein
MLNYCLKEKMLKHRVELITPESLSPYSYVSPYIIEQIEYVGN